MKSKTRKIISIVLRTIICVGAMYLVLRSVYLHDWATLPDGRMVKIVNWESISKPGDPRLDDPETIGQVRIELADEPHRITLGELARNPDGSPHFEIGLITVWKCSNKKLFLLAFLIFFPVAIIQSIRFTWMVRVQDIELSYWEGIKLSYAGNFLNYVAIGSTGGDIFKAYYVAAHTTRKTEAVTTVLLDRAIGLISLILIAAIAMAIRFDDPKIREWWHVIAVLMGLLLAGGVVVFSRRVRSLLRIEKILAKLPFGDQLLRIDAATHRMRHHKGLMVLCLLVTLLLQGLAIVGITVAGFGLGMNQSPDLWPGYFVYLSIAMLVAAIPVSYQGIGTVDGVLQICFKGLYGNFSQILFLGFAMRILQLICSLPGALVPITGAHRPSSEKIAQLQSLSRPSEL